MKVILDPNGNPSDLPSDSRIRFQFDTNTYLEVYHRDGSLVVRSDGWNGPLTIAPRVSNEIEVVTPSLSD